MKESMLNSMLLNKIKCLYLIDNLMSLEIIIEDKKINNNKVLEIKETKDLIKKILKEFKEDKRRGVKKQT